MIFKGNLFRKLMVGLLSSFLLLGAQVSFAQNAPEKQNTKQSTNQQVTKKKVVPKNQKQVRTSTTRAKSAKAPDEKRPSFAAAMGLRGNQDDLNLKSSVALIIDRLTHEVLFEKNAHAALPIASITKLMTSLVVLEAELSLDETIVISQSDVNVYPGRTRSRVTQGAKMTREQAMILSLMSSENRVSQALGRNFPGGIPAFVDAMNAKAKLLGMSQSIFADPTGLSSENVSSPEDLTRLVEAAYQHKAIREFSIRPDYSIMIGNREQKFVNTNRLVRANDMDIGLQKTGYISAAGRDVVMVFLDSVGKQSRFADAVRVREWLEANPNPESIRKL